MLGGDSSEETNYKTGSWQVGINAETEARQLGVQREGVLPWPSGQERLTGQVANTCKCLLWRRLVVQSICKDPDVGPSLLYWGTWIRALWLI